LIKRIKKLRILFKGEKADYESLDRTLGKLLRTRFDGRSARARNKTAGLARSALFGKICKRVKQLRRRIPKFYRNREIF
jgi:hypothetical protein